MKILVTGGTGLLAPYVREAFEQTGEVVLTSRSDRTYPCDLTCSEQVRALIRGVGPDVVIHLAALTDVDYCERNPEEARQANAVATANLVEALDAATCYLIYVSTDQVYPDDEGPFRESQAAPVNVYGATKLQGEEAARRHAESLIARINIIGASRTEGRSSLSDFFIGAFSEQKHITLFQDVFFSPLHMETLAQVLLECYRRKVTGTFNIGSRNGLSKKDFALNLAECKGLDASNVTIGNSSDIPGRAFRPKDLRMNVTRFERESGIKLPSLQEEIRKL